MIPSLQKYTSACCITVHTPAKFLLKVTTKRPRLFFYLPANTRMGCSPALCYSIFIEKSSRESHLDVVVGLEACSLVVLPMETFLPPKGSMPIGFVKQSLFFNHRWRGLTVRSHLDLVAGFEVWLTVPSMGLARVSGTWYLSTL